MRNDYPATVEYFGENGKSLGTELPAGHKVVTPTKQAPTDWLRWALAGGSGLLAHQIASSFMDSDEKKKDKSVWEKLLGILLPIGVGAAGAYGGYALGGKLGGNKTASVKTAQEGATNAYARVMVDGQHAADNDPRVNNKWYGIIYTRAREKGITPGEAAKEIMEENRTSAGISNWAGWGLGATSVGTGAAAALKAREAAKIKQNPFYPSKADIASQRMAIDDLAEQIRNAQSMPKGVVPQPARLNALNHNLASANGAFAESKKMMDSAQKARSTAGKLGWLSALSGLASGASFLKDWYDSDDARQASEADRRMTESFKTMVP